MKLKPSFGTGIAVLLPFLIAGCDNDSSSSKAAAAAFGIYSIDTSGGTGGATGGNGGGGGGVDLYKSNGPTDIVVLGSGNADAAFAAITPSANLGTNPLNVTANTTIAVVTVEPAAGTPYLVADDATLRVSDANGILSDETAVTGISVASGITLTLGLNFSGATQAQIALRNDVSNSGTITTVDASATNRGDLRMDVDSYIGASSSSITTAGTLINQNGGDVEIAAARSIYNHGGVTTSGSDSATGNGGNGGLAQMNASRSLQNTAAINSRGGDAVAGTAGSGGAIELQAFGGTLHNSGDLSSYGGNGVTGGDGSSVNLFAEAAATNLLNSGDSDSHGGNGSGGNAGSGGSVTLETNGGKLIHDGNITTAGGDATADTFNAGDGGNVQFNAYDGTVGDGTTPAAGMTISGNIDTSGGDAMATSTGSGGSGGGVSAEMDSVPTDASINARMAWLGYGNVNTSGGDGNFGGSAADFQITNDDTSANSVNLPSGNITNEANLVARGGNAVASATVFPANGGDGGRFRLETEYNYGYNVPELEMVTNAGTADLSGGSNLKATSSSAGNSGYVWFWGYNGVTNTGALTANGGSDADTDGGTTGYGGYGNDISMYAETGAVTNSAALTSNGGNGEYRGGYSDGIFLFAATVSNAANLTANGGNANASLAASQGGDGGFIELFSPKGSAGISHSGTVTQTAGTGTVAANPGSFVSGGLCTGYC